MGQNSAIVPEDLDAISSRSPSSIPALRSRTAKIQSLHHDTLSALRDLIVHNELPAGSRLTESMLSERFSVSRTPLAPAWGVIGQVGLAWLLNSKPGWQGRITSVLEEMAANGKARTGQEYFAALNTFKELERSLSSIVVGIGIVAVVGP